MAIQLPNFPMLTPEQADPRLAGLQGGLKSYQALIQNMFAPALHQQELEKQKLINKYFGPQKEAEIALKNIELQYAPEMQKENLLQKQLANMINKVKAEHAQELVETELAEKKTLTKMHEQNANLPFGGKIPPGPAGQIVGLEMVKQQYGKESPQYDMAYKAFNANVKRMQNVGAGVGVKELQSLQDQLKIEYPELTDIQRNQAASSLIEGKRELPDGTQLHEPSGISRALLDEIYKRRNQAQAVNQQRRAATLDNMLKSQEKFMPSVLKYAGLKGELQGTLDKAKTALGAESDDYNNYFNFTRIFLPSVASEFIITLGAYSTDTQKKMMLDLANPITWDSNPKTAMKAWNYLNNLYRNVITPSIMQSPTQIYDRMKAVSNDKYEKDLLTGIEKNKSDNLLPKKVINGKTYIKRADGWHTND